MPDLQVLGFDFTASHITSNLRYCNILALIKPIKCFLLVGPQTESLWSIVQLFRRRLAQVGPINWSAGKVAIADHLEIGPKESMVRRTFGPNSAPVWTRIRFVNSSPAEADMNESICHFETRVSSAKHLH